MLNAIIVGAGGFIGSTLRYLVGVAISRMPGHHSFPWATLAVNVTGCFLIGILGGYFLSRDATHEQVRLFVLVGILGGFTTFSTFGNETLQLFKSAQPAAALLNVMLHIFLGLGAAWYGYHVVK